MAEAKMICPFCGTTNIIGDKVIAFRCCNCNEIVNYTDPNQRTVTRRRRNENITDATFTYVERDEARIKEADGYKRGETLHGVASVLSSIAEILEAFFGGLAHVAGSIKTSGWVVICIIVIFIILAVYNS